MSTLQGANVDCETVLNSSALTFRILEMFVFEAVNLVFLER